MRLCPEGVAHGYFRDCINVYDQCVRFYASCLIYITTLLCNLSVRFPHTWGGGIEGLLDGNVHIAISDIPVWSRSSGLPN